MNLQIKEIMSERGMTSVALADSIGISKVAMSNIITGKSMPSLETLIKMSEVLKVTISELIGETERKQEAVIYCPHCKQPITIKLS